MKYDISVGVVVTVRLCGVEADSPREALEKATSDDDLFRRLLDNKGGDVASAPEIDENVTVAYIKCAEDFTLAYVDGADAQTGFEYDDHRWLERRRR